MPQFQTDLDCEFLGEISASVYFDYTPAEPAIMNPIDKAEPGCAEEADVTCVEILINGTTCDVMEMIPEFYVSELEERAIEFINQQDEE